MISIDLPILHCSDQCKFRIRNGSKGDNQSDPSMGISITLGTTSEMTSGVTFGTTLAITSGNTSRITLGGSL